MVALAPDREVSVVERQDPTAARGERPRFVINGARPCPVGIQFDPTLLFESWVDIGRRVSLHSSASLWWLGDWLVYGKYKYGRRYKIGVAATGLDYQTLRNYAVVARRFELSRRRDKLSFQHHAEVCALSDEEQDFWLNRAESHKWSRNELRRRLRAAVAAGDLAEVHVLRLAVDAEREGRWRAAAELHSSELSAWIVGTLDAAARHVLVER